MAGRKKLSPAEPGTEIQILSKTPPTIAAQEILARDAGELASREQVMRWLMTMLHIGRAQSAIVAATVSDRMIAESYSKAVESKAYIGLPYDKPDGTPGNVSSLDEFCTVFFGKGARRCRQIAENLETLGVDLFDAAEKIGLGQRDYNALKVLPADDQEVIKQAIAEGGDRNAVIGMLTQLAGRQAAEKAELQANLEAKDDRAAKREREIERKTIEIAKLKKEGAKATPDEVAEKLRAAASRAALGVRAEIAATGTDAKGAPLGTLSTTFAALVEHGVDNDTDHGDFLGGLIGELFTELRKVRDAYALPIINDAAG